MEEINQTHLSNILSFLQQKRSVTGFKPLTNAIQIQLRRNKPPDQVDETKKLASMCTRCFTSWREGNFTVKFKPKYKRGKLISKRMVLRCSICNHKEYQSYNHSKVDSSIDKKKTKPITNMKRNSISLKSKCKKNTTKLVTSKAKTKTTNKPSKHLKKNKSKQKVKRKVTR